MVRLSTKHFPGVSFLVDKSFECENASENAAARFDLAGPLINLLLYYCVTPPDRWYRRICTKRLVSNRLTSGYAANTNKTYGGKSSYAMYFMPYIVDSVVPFINDENMAPRDVSAPNGAQ